MRSMTRILTVVMACALFAPVAVAADDAAVPVAQGLVAAWDFRGADAKVVKDLTGRGHDATVAAGAPTYVDSPAGKAIVLDGKTSLTVKGHADFAMTDVVTVDAWVWIDAPPEKYQCVLRKGGAAFRMQVMGGGKAYFGMKGPGKPKRVDVAGGAIAPKTWARITGVFKKPVVELYLNGKKVSSRKIPEFQMHEQGEIFIGAYDARASWPFIGRIDQVRIYNIARPPQPGDEKPLAAKAAPL